MTGRLTLGLHNCYDPKQWHDVMRVTLARAAPVALAFDCDVATFGFPFAQARRRGATSTQGLRTPQDVADFVAEGTSIGEGGEAFRELVAQRRFHIHPFPEEPAAPRDEAAEAALQGRGRASATASAGAGYPPALGEAVLTTPHPAPGRAIGPRRVAEDLAQGHARLLVFGLGPRGLPGHLLAAAPWHLEITGRGISMETATALGALPAMVRAHLEHLEGPEGARAARGPTSALRGQGAAPR